MGLFIVHFCIIMFHNYSYSQVPLNETEKIIPPKRRIPKLAILLSVISLYLLYNVIPSKKHRRKNAFPKHLKKKFENQNWVKNRGDAKECKTWIRNKTSQTILRNIEVINFLSKNILYQWVAFQKSKQQDILNFEWTTHKCIHTLFTAAVSLDMNFSKTKFCSISFEIN